jgi:hypothetical protein
MFICPWCGTGYLAFRSNCQNCGGPLLAGGQDGTSTLPGDELPIPPAAPRPISNRYLWRLLSTDGWSIAGCVFGVLGLVFGAVGAGLSVGAHAAATALVGIPFLALGLAFLIAAGISLGWRYQEMKKVVGVLREGSPTRGRVTGVSENYSVRVNGRHPWVIGYEYQVDGTTYPGKVSTLNPPGQELQEGLPVTVLYLATHPARSSIYPHP